MPSSPDFGEELEAFIDRAVKKGRYGSRSELLREGVRLVQKQEAAWERFEAEMRIGIEDAKAGRSRPVDEVFDELDAYVEELIAAQEAEARRDAA